jgi:dipeptidyl aminopeptidase/acylaminoacyl peptidase
VYRGLLGLILLPLPGLALDTWTLDDLLTFRQISSARISPDGRYVLYALDWSIPAENRRCSDLWVVRSDGRETRRLTNSDEKEQSPEWLPDSRRVSYIARERVWVIPADVGQPAPLTRGGQRVRWFAWSGDGARLLYLTAEGKTGEQTAHEKEWGVVISPEEQWPERGRLRLLDISSGQARELSDGTSMPRGAAFSPDGRTVAFLDARGLHIGQKTYAKLAGEFQSLAWSPDGKSVAFVAADPDPQPYLNLFQRAVFLGSGGVGAVEVASGSARMLDSARYPGLAQVLWSPDSARLAFLAKPPGSEGNRLALDELHILSLTGGVRKVAPGFDFLRGGIGMRWTSGGGELWFLNGERMGYNLFAVDAASGAVRHLTTGQDTISEVSYTSDFSAAAYVRENVNTKPDIHVTKLPAWSGTRITDLNPEVRRFAHGPGEIIQYPSEGRQIEALLIKPPDFDARKKYPLILIIHGGPTWYKKNEWRPEWEQHPIQVYASQGYCLVFPNVRGSADYGPAFRQANFRDLGGGDARDALAAVDHLVRQGFIDERKLGIAGWSYGGYLVPAILTQTNRFRAAQFGAGIPSFEAMYSRLSTVEWIVHENYGPRPWEDAAMQVAGSPLYAAHKVKTPTLIEHGEEDPRCPVGGSVLFYKALRFYGVPAVLEIYPKEGHGIVGPLLRRRCLRRNLEWFNKWLKGDKSTSFEKLFPNRYDP